MSKSFDDVEAKCPYFIYSLKKMIVCEGIMDGCTTKLEFKSQDKRNQHRRLFCDSKYCYCEINRMLEEIYDEE